MTRMHIRWLGLAAVGLIGLAAAASPALAAPIADGTSNTTQVADTSAVLRVMAERADGAAVILYNGHAGLGALKLPDGPVIAH